MNVLDLCGSCTSRQFRQPGATRVFFLNNQEQPELMLSNAHQLVVVEPPLLAVLEFTGQFFLFYILKK